MAKLQHPSPKKLENDAFASFGIGFPATPEIVTARASHPGRMLARVLEVLIAAQSSEVIRYARDTL